MANALGATDREAMDGILRQLVRASVSGGSPDEVNLSFMISMMKSIRPRDSVEMMENRTAQAADPNDPMANTASARFGQNLVSAN
ncbi:hypothetical protein [Bradyrhizobium cenepequi]|uniref:hypothetical protein n=1 Tax=Bradyrhizobium cenepequi TaxID=2821403 RepID=UPI001CE2B45C|nr:hypothetical protein [Bradyrhizobium cenepequi]MCA6108635.1 hypothetical protein [Bradyrhizobium cenepequi]